MPPTPTAPAPPAPTRLSEEEQMFRDAVRDLAERDVRPRTAAMEQAAELDPTLIPKFFELGLMGIEIPETYNGAGGSLFMTVLAVEGLSAVDAAAATVRDGEKTPGKPLRVKWAGEGHRAR